MEIKGEMKRSKFKKICVFCGSSPGKRSSYKEAAVELGKELVYIFLLSVFIFKFLPHNFLLLFFG